MRRLSAGVATLCLSIVSIGCGEGSTPDAQAKPASTTSASSPNAASASAAAAATSSEAPAAHERQVYFGDLHVHSSWSMDAYASGVRVGPEEAYRYARGEAIPHISGQPIQLAGPPLDFMALTDHAEYLGVIAATQEPVHPLHAAGLFRQWIGNDPRAARWAWRQIMNSFGRREGFPAFIADDVVRPAWQELIALADRHDEPGVFTAFVAYEYTSNPNFQNLHRNVIFKGPSVAARPFSSMDSANPEDLWRWMDATRAEGDDLLAIPHNSNGSNGLMFARVKSDGSAIDRVWIDQRIRNEPLVEVMQIKGQSETRPSLSPNDEWAAFEVTPWRTINPAFASEARGSYARDALLAGLQFHESLGRNPYALGMVGSTDGHNASSPFEEANYTGKIGRSDGTPEARLAGSSDPKANPLANVGLFWGAAAGLAGIWSDANTRADLFDAMRRRETFSTSGPRIRVRFFAGWDLEAQDAGGDHARAGYARGVPMGGELSARGRKGNDEAGAPTFLLAALKDPLEANLERIQIVKGWLEGDEPRERVYDIACGDGAAPGPGTHRCPNEAGPPDLTSCALDASFGASEFDAWWRDPEFDPAQRAFYYVRVLQVPTCRWSTWDAIRQGAPMPQWVPLTIQERAITSPIWIEPSRDSNG